MGADVDTDTKTNVHSVLCVKQFYTYDVRGDRRPGRSPARPAQGELRAASMMITHTRPSVGRGAKDR